MSVSIFPYSVGNVIGGSDWSSKGVNDDGKGTMMSPLKLIDSFDDDGLSWLGEGYEAMLRGPSTLSLASLWSMIIKYNIVE